MANDRRPDARALAVDLQHLRFAVAAADIGSFRQAADALGASSIAANPMYSSARALDWGRRVRAIERWREADTRRPRVLRTARLILEQVNSLIASAKTTERSEAGKLAVGFCTSLSTGNLRAVLLDFKTYFPHIELATVERSRTRLATALRNGTVDILVVTGEVPLPDNNVRPLWSERILLSMPENHPLAAGTVVYWTDLRNETVLLSQHDPGRELEDLLISKLVSPADRPKIERHDVNRGIIKNLISMKFGISLVLRIRYRRELRWAGLSRIARRGRTDTR